MTAIELADRLYKSAKKKSVERNSAYDKYGWGNTPENTDSLKTDAAAMLRKQAEAIKVLREALESLAFSVDNACCGIVLSKVQAKQALKDTEEFK